MKLKQRDGNIFKAYKREINTQTRTIKSKKTYTRKVKHKKSQSFV